MKKGSPAIGIIGGSGLYQMQELRDATERKIGTPFGAPSDVLIGGNVSGRQVYFLPRHGRGHRLLPHELNHRANIYALRSLNVRWIISVTAVGSLQEKYAPRNVLLPSQFYDRTSDCRAYGGVAKRPGNGFAFNRLCTSLSDHGFVPRSLKIATPITPTFRVS